MDRAAKLAAEARQFLDLERKCAQHDLEAARSLTRLCLSARAFELGYSTELEISAAIDEALTAAGATP